MKDFSSVVLVAALALLLGGCRKDAARLAADAPGITALCKGGTLAACPRDARLIFRVNGLSGQFFLSAFTENTASGEVLWIAPGPDDDPSPVTVRAGEQVLTQVVPVQMLTEGNYRVHAMLTREPPTRQEVLTAKITSAATSTVALTVTKKTRRTHSVFE
ncbi:MAG: hypothetical protein ABI488_18085 [Polyangiaceae bacterium]